MMPNALKYLEHKKISEITGVSFIIGLLISIFINFKLS